MDKTSPRVYSFGLESFCLWSELIERLTRCWCGVEGRDKFCKMIQYGSRFIKYQADGKNQDVHNAFKGLFGKYELLDWKLLTERLMLQRTWALRESCSVCSSHSTSGWRSGTSKRANCLTLKRTCRSWPDWPSCSIGSLITWPSWSRWSSWRASSWNQWHAVQASAGSLESGCPFLSRSLSSTRPPIVKVSWCSARQMHRKTPSRTLWRSLTLSSRFVLRKRPRFSMLSRTWVILSQPHKLSVTQSASLASTSPMAGSEPVVSHPLRSPAISCTSEESGTQASHTQVVHIV